jgi:3-phenylpropionate/trans-cinnamate dioxygenase ferredoxin reductase subunit
VAASLRQKGVDVVAIDPSKTPLFRVLGEAVGQTIADLHRAHGVRTIFEDTVAGFEGTRRVTHVFTNAGLRLECDFVLVGIGIEPAVELLDGSGILVDNGVVVDEYCQTNVSGVYAAGDVANHYHPIFDRRIRVEHWQNAIKQGAAAARNMLGKHVAYDEVHSQVDAFVPKLLDIHRAPGLDERHDTPHVLRPVETDSRIDTATNDIAREVLHVRHDAFARESGVPRAP